MSTLRRWPAPFAIFCCLTPGMLAPAVLAQPAGLEIVAKLDEAPGNITISPDSRIFVSLHQFFEPRVCAAELLPDGTLRTFPNPAWNRPVTQDGPHPTLDSVLGLQCDESGVVWLLDNGLRGKSVPKLVAWDSRKDRLERLIHMPPPASRADSFVNDLALDIPNDAIYIADPASGGNAALIVVNLRTGLARRVLEGHVSVRPEPLDLAVSGQLVQIRRPDGTLFKPRVGVNPIVIDAAREWVYYGPMHGTGLYRVPATALRDESLSPAALAEKVERVCDKPISDGSAMDADGNIYVSEIAANAVGVITPKRQYQRLFQDDLLSWPDAFAMGKDGWVYCVANQLHRSAPLNAGANTAKPPFVIVRFKMRGE